MLVLTSFVALQLSSRWNGVGPALVVAEYPVLIYEVGCQSVRGLHARPKPYNSLRIAVVKLNNFRLVIHS